MPITLETAVALLLGERNRAVIFDPSREIPVFACAWVNRPDAAAADALWDHVRFNDANKVAFREAGAIPLFVGLLETGGADVRYYAANALETVAVNAENRVVIREAGGIPPLLALAEGGGRAATSSAAALRVLARNNDENAVATVLARGRVEAIVELARRGSVTIRAELYGNQGIVDLVVVQNAGAGAKRKAALLVAKLFRDCVEFPAPYDIKVAIASYL